MFTSKDAFWIWFLSIDSKQQFIWEIISQGIGDRVVGSETCELVFLFPLSTPFLADYRKSPLAWWVEAFARMSTSLVTFQFAQLQCISSREPSLFSRMSNDLFWSRSSYCVLSAAEEFAGKKFKHVRELILICSHLCKRNASQKLQRRMWRLGMLTYTVYINTEMPVKLGIFPNGNALVALYAWLC